MKTSKRALKALRLEINDWNDIAYDGYPDGGESGLCEQYRKNMCQACPVKIETGKPICQDTPYWNWFNYQARKKMKLYFVFDEKSQRFAVAHFDWLEALYKKLVRRNKQKARGK